MLRERGAVRPDAFDVVAWATDALDEVRRQAWNDARTLAGTEGTRVRGRPPPRPGRERARKLKNTRYALWKNPANLTEAQSAKLAWMAKTDPRLHRPYLPKEGLRHVLAVKGDVGKQAPHRWLGSAARSRIPAFITLGRKIRKHRTAIDAALAHNVSNALIEATIIWSPVRAVFDVDD